MPDETNCLDPVIGRRRALRLIGAACCAAAGLPQLSGCGPSGQSRESSAVLIDPAALQREGRMIVTWNDQPVEVRWAAGKVSARSLVCTHMGCIVRWDEEQSRYLCPCHKGVFGADGSVISGAPTLPLTEVPVSVSDTAITVGS